MRAKAAKNALSIDQDYEMKKKVAANNNQWLPGRAQTRAGQNSNNRYIEDLNAKFQKSMERKVDFSLPGMQCMLPETAKMLNARDANRKL